jgi:quinol monooxygenase YgiN
MARTLPPVLVVTRFDVPEADGVDFLARARTALAAFRARPGYVRGRIGRSADDPTAWVMTTEWDGVGAYRRSLSAYDVKVDAAPLLSLGRDEPSAFEVLSADDDESPTSRAADAATVGLSRASGPDVPTSL